MSAGSGWTRLLKITGAAAVSLALLTLLAHAPRVRARVLAYAIGVLNARGVQGRAARLDYNLLTLRMALHDVAVDLPGQAN